MKRSRRSLRRWQLERVVARRVSDFLNLWPNQRVLTQREIVRCKNFHPCECGKPRCGLCHREKLDGSARRDEQVHRGLHPEWDGR